MRSSPFPLALALLSALVLAGSAAAANRPATALDRIAAVVNDEVITESEFRARLAEVKKQLAAQRIPAPPEPRLRQQVLERMVGETLQLQVARRQGIKVNDAQLDQAIANIARKNNLTPEALYQSLRRQGLDPARYRAQIRNQVAIQQLLEREVHNRVIVTDGEVEAFLARSEAQSAAAAEYNLSHILITLPESASSELIQEARERAERVWRELRQGADFRQLALAHSQGQTALEGGDLGWKKPGQLPALFVEAVKKLQPGEVSEVLRSPNGFHILKLNGRKGQPAAKAHPVTQTHVRHILVRLSEVVTAEEAGRRIQQLRARIEQGEDFATLARAHSEDPGTAGSGGDLGWLSPGQTAPEFEKAAAALKPGALSGPVRTAYGFHLIQVLERRARDSGEERSQASAREQIHARKADERYEQWLRQLRDESYVEYRLDSAN
jgi:peptidyl-prolyl cis-trans isomerase SurA